MDKITINISEQNAENRVIVDISESDDIYLNISKEEIDKIDWAVLIKKINTCESVQDLRKINWSEPVPTVSKLDMDFYVDIMCIFWVNVFMIMIVGLVYIWCNIK